MKDFFSDTVLLNNNTAISLYKEIKDLPIVDYHCHLDQKKIKEDTSFNDIGELWLAGDHYKWRAMRLCGVEEKYITGDASYHDKFIKYAEIMPKLIGNPLYYWSHFELKQIFDINLPLNKENAEEIYKKANEKLKDLSVRKMLKHFNVKYICTTDDPVDDLNDHGVYNDIKVIPTFRPDRVYNPCSYVSLLENAVGKKINTAKEYVDALEGRLDYFLLKGCKISDHGFNKFPKQYVDDSKAEELFKNREELSESDKELFFGWLLVKLTKMYGKKHIAMQIHFNVIRNNNWEMHKICGPDSGFDLIGEAQNVEDLVLFFNQIKDEERPETIIYTLNDSNLSALAAVTGAFRHVRLGPAWWFNDTLEGIKRNISIMAEYSTLGTSLGMLTDSRSFSSYSRFDFFRRIICDYVGEKVEKGEYDYHSALDLLKDICYNNSNKLVGD